jgi:hypothetical protein
VLENIINLSVDNEPQTSIALLTSQEIFVVTASRKKPKINTEFLMDSFQYSTGALIIKSRPTTGNSSQ